MPKRKRKTNLNPATLFSLGVIVFLAIVGAVLALQAQRKDLAFNLAPKAASCLSPSYCSTSLCTDGFYQDDFATCSDIYSICCKPNPSPAPIASPTPTKPPCPVLTSDTYFYTCYGNTDTCYAYGGAVESYYSCKEITGSNTDVCCNTGPIPTSIPTDYKYSAIKTLYWDNKCSKVGTANKTGSYATAKECCSALGLKVTNTTEGSIPCTSKCSTYKSTNYKSQNTYCFPE
jgi:hypothetical protein